MAPSHSHQYRVVVTWTGDRGEGTSSYGAYSRDHEISSPDGHKPTILASSDPAYRGDSARWNPEELLVASLAACHKLWYLHLCADAGVVVTAYADLADGWMAPDEDGVVRFTRVLLRPVVTIATSSDVELARSLHAEAHRRCYIANSVSFPVEHHPEIRTDG